MKRLSVIISLLAIVACKKETTKPVEEECNAVFEVALDLDHYAKDSLGNYMDMPRFHYYEEHNFILDKSDRIFYYPQVVFRGWNCIVPEKMPPIPPPDFINLHPQQIIELTKDQLQDFVKKNINTRDKTSFITIASEREKFRSKNLCKLYESIYHNNSRNWTILRRMTEEEKVVMKYKKSEDFYFPEDVKWKATNLKKEKPRNY